MYINHTDNIGTLTFEKKVDKYAALHFARRLAHLDPDGIPPKEITSHPSQIYVLEVVNHLATVRSAVRECRTLVSQVEIPPPESWLSEMILSKDEFRQQSLDLFTIVLHSILDRTLLLVNVVFDLGISPRNCSMKKVKRTLPEGTEDLATELSSLQDAVVRIADARHQFAHRGRHREVSMFSAIEDTKTILKGWGLTFEGLTLNDPGALLRIMNQDLAFTSNQLIAALDCLTSPFLSNMRVVGGPDLPSDDEIAEARSVLEHLKGGGDLPGRLG